MTNNIYQRIFEERNRLKTVDPVGFQLEALSQILCIVFTNEDTLPKSFTIKDVLISKYQLHMLLLNLGIECDFNSITVHRNPYEVSFEVIIK